MTKTNDYQRLERAARLIARHPFFPGKDDAVADCIDDIEERCRLGLLSAEQRSRLIAIVRETRGEHVAVD
jgi:hypothetical protein